MNEQREITVWLRQRVQEQVRLCGRVEDALRGDPRFVAAWWFGSYARGEPDALSDLDIWTVVDDGYLEHLLAERHSFVTLVGQPLMKLEVWGNAPDPGAYLMANYLRPSGLYQVDWYWQSAFQAKLPRDARVIFDRAGLPSASNRVTVDFARGPQAQAAGNVGKLEEARQRLSFNTLFFWSMVPIAAKKIARREFGAATSLLEKLISLVNSMAALLEIPPCQLELPAEKLDAAEPALDQIATLRHIIAFAQAMEPAIAATGAALPSAIHRPIGDHIDRIVQVIQSGVALREITPNAR